MGLGLGLGVWVWVRVRVRVWVWVWAWAWVWVRIWVAGLALTWAIAWNCSTLPGPTAARYKAEQLVGWSEYDGDP